MSRPSCRRRLIVKFVAKSNALVRPDYVGLGVEGRGCVPMKVAVPGICRSTQTVAACFDTSAGLNDDGTRSTRG